MPRLPVGDGRLSIHSVLSFVRSGSMSGRVGSSIVSSQVLLSVIALLHWWEPGVYELFLGYGLYSLFRRG